MSDLAVGGTSSRSAAATKTSAVTEMGQKWAAGGEAAGEPSEAGGASAGAAGALDGPCHA